MLSVAETARLFKYRTLNRNNEILWSNTEATAKHTESAVRHVRPSRRASREKSAGASRAVKSKETLMRPTIWMRKQLSSSKRSILSTRPSTSSLSLPCQADKLTNRLLERGLPAPLGMPRRALCSTYAPCVNTRSSKSTI